MNTEIDETAKWQAAAEAAPTNEDMRDLAEAITAAEELVEEAHRNYRVAAVRKATIWGWSAIAKDLGVSPKMLHTWHQRYCPELEDLSSIPQREKARTEAAERKIQARAEKAAREAAEMERLAAKLKDKKERLMALSI